MTKQLVSTGFILLLLAGCNGQDTDSSGSSPVPETVIARISERWLTVRDETDNVDSVAVWTDGDQRHWLLATAKESDKLIVYDATSGKRVSETGSTGDQPGQYLRPNGIQVVGDTVWVVERDNRRVQILQLPSFRPLGSFGQDQLSKPYGLWTMTTGDGQFRLFVTDSYETDDEQVPPDSELDRRLQRFDVTLTDRGVVAEHAGALGPVAGDGRLRKVESLWGDIVHNRLLVADEHETVLNIKQFDLDGRYSGQNMADGILKYEPEGIALYRCEDGSGYWVVTDQDHHDNRFLLFDRQTLELLSGFSGEQTSNTDGVWLHQNALPGFPQGAFYAVHDDGNVAAFDFSDILTATQLEACAD